ncbi:MAG: lipoprotein, partial [Microthrixaceae bacterium]|nr:lipoprotein [Microthrixaceae bacterium]
MRRSLLALGALALLSSSAA